MNNFEVATNGVSIASRVLGLIPPDVSFFKDRNLSRKGINSMYLKDIDTIVFDETWIEAAEWIEIIVVCFHEVRHCFQYKFIHKLTKTKEIIKNDLIEKWKFEFNNYQQANSIPETSENYLNQAIEIDAISFSYYMINKLFQCKVDLPVKIRDKVEMYVEEFTKLY